ncbi:MAG: hypothetical protein QOD41_356, partial [Cryptosporangiaceae bacterium]|nr:hypothetical protein [Cryptosporangiaceae bacterium]
MPGQQRRGGTGGNDRRDRRDGGRGGQAPEKSPHIERV